VHGPDVPYTEAFQRHLANRQIHSISLSPYRTRRTERAVRVFFPLAPGILTKPGSIREYVESQAHEDRFRIAGAG
jgi:hypothetical protein